MMDIDWTTLLMQLAEPFPASSVHWRAGVVSRDRKRAQALPYAEPRAYEDRLNTVCPGLWSVSFEPWHDARIICELTVAGLTRASTGEENDGFAPGTAAEAQAFKRACVKFGLGRYLYDVPIKWVPYDEVSRKLRDTPVLAPRFLPQERPATLSNTRASAMHRELAKLGIDKGEHYTFASRALGGREVTSFTHLTDAEATTVYNEALRKADKAQGKRAM